MRAPGNADAPPPPRRWLVRLGWLGLYWVLGVAAMGLVAGLLRALMRAVGLGL